MGLQGLAVGLDVVLPVRTSVAVASGDTVSLTGAVNWGFPAPQLRQSSCVSLGAFPAQTDSTEFTMAVINGDSVNTVVTFGILGNRGLSGASDADHIKLTTGFAPAAALVLDYSVGGVRRGAGGTGTMTTPFNGTMMVGVKRGLTCEMWQSTQAAPRVGTLRDSITYTTGQLTATAKTCYLGCDEASVTSYPAFAAFWPARALSPAELALLFADPLSLVL